MVRKPAMNNANQSGTQDTPYKTQLHGTEQDRGAIRSEDSSRFADVTHDNDPRLEPSNGPDLWQSSSFNPWHGDDTRVLSEDLPSILKAGGGDRVLEQSRSVGLPSILHAGSTENTPRSSWESQRSIDPNQTRSTPFQPPIQTISELPSAVTSTNPYHRSHSRNRKLPHRDGYDEVSSADIWGNGPEAPPLQQSQVPIQHPFTEPWTNIEPSRDEEGYETRWVDPNDQENQTPPEVLESNIANHRVTNLPVSSLQPQENSSKHSPPTVIGQDPNQFPAALDQDPTPNYDPVDHGLPGVPNQVPVQHPDGLNEYSILSSDGRLHEPPQLDDHLAEHPINAPHSTEKASSGFAGNDDFRPALPPRNSHETEEGPPPQPPRPTKTNDVQIAETQSQQDESARIKRARETYQIRKVNWFDTSSPTNPRESPIMVQNANGPCPLLALVNALVLSTPAEYATALIETLRVREQVTLGLLIDAVIDELISRNGDLPDVTDMYAFLVTLHTGMNVNPLFVRLETSLNLMDAPLEHQLTGNPHHSHKAGGFEDTREMKLYSTFAIPLIHGWMPPKDHPAFASLERNAKTYEDAQNLMFKEEELEDQLKRQGLSPEEQILLEDIASVKYYLSSTATQLTRYGLDTMTETMLPGSIAILFRNDHFSTLYKHPKSGQLLTLVTDMGYAGHDEVVWESLVDINGQRCEFFSGDFRPVGNVTGDTQSRSQRQDEGWTTVNSRPRRSAAPNRHPSHSNLPQLSTLTIDDKQASLSSNTEQEDHDLALAMQLQEEEEERDRQEAAARRREDELSQAYLNSSDSSGRKTFPGFSTGARAARGGPSPPPRGGGSGRGVPNQRPAPPRKSVDTEEPPPPTYEQAARGQAYHPPAHHPSHPYASPGADRSTARPLPPRPRESTTFVDHANSHSSSPLRGHYVGPSGSSATGGGGIDPSLVRRRSGVPGSAAPLDDGRKEKDCVMM